MLILTSNATNILLQCRQRLCKVSIAEIHREVRENKILMASLLDDLKGMPDVNMQNIQKLMKTEENKVIAIKSKKHTIKQNNSLDKLPPENMKTSHESLVSSEKRCEKRHKSAKRKKTMRQNYQRNLKSRKKAALEK